MDQKQIIDILNKHKDKNFVQRIFNPELSLGESTHEMSYGETDGKYIVFPTLVEKNGDLVELEDPMGYALENNEFIEFSSENEANVFSQQYKKVWE